MHQSPQPQARRAGIQRAPRIDRRSHQKATPREGSQEAPKTTTPRMRIRRMHQSPQPQARRAGIQRAQMIERRSHRKATPREGSQEAPKTTTLRMRIRRMHQSPQPGGAEDDDAENADTADAS